MNTKRRIKDFGRVLLIVFIITLMVLLYVALKDASGVPLIVYEGLCAFCLFVLIKPFLQDRETASDSIGMYRLNKPSRRTEEQYIQYMKFCLYAFTAIFGLYLVFVAFNGYLGKNFEYLDATIYPMLFSIHAIFNNFSEIAFVTKVMLLLFCGVTLYGYYLFLINSVRLFESYDVINKKFTDNSFVQVKKIGLGFAIVATTLSLAVVPFEIAFTTDPEIFNYSLDTFTGFKFEFESGRPGNKSIKIEWALALAGELFIVLSEFMRHGLNLEEEVEATV